MSLQDHTTLRAMNRRSSLENDSMENSQTSQEKCEIFKDIRKYFSEEEWAKLGNSDKITYVCLKRNYDDMTSQGLMAKLPHFMRPKNVIKKAVEHISNEGWNSVKQEFSGASGVSQNFGNMYHRRTLLWQLLVDDYPPETSTIQPREHLKVSPKSEGPQSLSFDTDVNMMLPVKEESEENDMKPLPVSPDSEPAQKQLCPVGEVKAPSQLRKTVPAFQNKFSSRTEFPLCAEMCGCMSGSREWKTNVWVHRLRERKNYVVYEEISDPEEEDD